MPSVFKLKKLLTESTDLGEVLSYFLTITETTNIIPGSKALNEEEINNNDTLNILIQMVEKMTGDYIKKTTHISHPMISTIEDQHFYHGICVSKDIAMPITLFYFSDIKKGFFAFSGITNKTEMFRFSLAHLDKDKIPIMNSSAMAH